MKNLIITSLSVLALAMAFTGCGDSGSVTGVTDDSVSGGNVVVNPVTDVNTDSGAATTPKTPFNLSDKLGTPPGLPN